MPSYCCFLCPKRDYSEKKVSDVCEGCGNAFGFPLDTPPKAIRGYEITKSLARGFYSAVYVAVRGTLAKKVVLKIAPKAIYAFFGKDFNAECKKHNEVAADTDHLVDIHEVFDEMVEFDGRVIDCHVAVL